VTDHFFIPYLTHLACKGVDVDAPLTFQRYPFTTRAEEWFLFLTTSGAAATIVAAGGLSLRAMARHGLSGLRRPATLATLALLLGTSGGVCYWFHAITRNRLAPDLEDIGFGSSWWQQAGGIAMAAMLTTYVVYLGWRASASLLTTPKDLHASLALPLASENFFALVLLSTTAMLRLGQIIWTNLGEDFLATPMDALGYLPYLVVDPLTYFITAMLILSFQLIRFCWKGQAPAPLVIIPLKSSDFIVAWLILAAIFAVAILTFAAFGFSFWLGPWYRW
jgi:hypothetical protein